MKNVYSILLVLGLLMLSAWAEKDDGPTWQDYRERRDGKPYTDLASRLKGQMIIPAGEIIAGKDIQGTFQPSFTVAPNGDYLVFAQGRIGSDEDKAPKILLMVRSTDQGEIWSEPISIAAPKGSFFSVNSFTDTTRNLVHVLFKTGSAWQITSSDNGHTWMEWNSKNVSKGFGIREKLWRGRKVNSNIFLGQAIKLQNGEKNGRIVLGAIQKYNADDKCPVAVWSDDAGETWQHGEGFPDFTKHYGMSEPAVVELSDGRLMMITRDAERTARRYSISQDYGQTWGPVQTAFDLPAPGCFGSLCSMTVEVRGKQKHVLLFASPANRNRREGTIYYSLDDGESWESKLLDEELFSYSTISPLPNGEFVVCYTKGWHGSRGIYFVKTDLDWLL